MTSNHPSDALSRIRAFAGSSVDYYQREFVRLQESRNWAPSLNLAVLALGPLWAAARGVWVLFWIEAFVELVALIQACRGWYGNLGSELLLQAVSLQRVAVDRLADSTAARAAGDPATAETFARIARNLTAAAKVAFDQAHSASMGGHHLVWIGLSMLVLARIAASVTANALYERQYTAWRAGATTATGLRAIRAAIGVIAMAMVYPLTVYRFAANDIPPALTRVPARRAAFDALARMIDRFFEAAYSSSGALFDGIRDMIRAGVRLFELLLVDTPWPVVMGVLLIAAWRLAGRRVALLTAGSIAYLAVLGLWEQAMQTVALLGTAALICVAIGIPLGVWLSRSAGARAVTLPVLDLMQTMPALVYLIPAIAFFGTGTPPGIIATLIFGLPPVVRLTALGLSQVPADVREAARAYGASEWQLLTGVDLPLAKPAIMAGVNQTILMCLSMVVIASLIGAQGLGAVVLESLQFAASGQGLLAGIAILLCAIVIDRIVQGAFGRSRADSTGRDRPGNDA